MSVIEELAALAPGSIQISAAIRGTAPKAGLKGTELAGLLAGLPLLQESLAWCKFVGDMSSWGDLVKEYRTALVEMESPVGEQFDIASAWILRNHMKDWRCEVCNGTGRLYLCACPLCEGTGDTELQPEQIALQAQLPLPWCTNTIGELRAARALLIDAENELIIHLTTGNENA